MALQKTRNPRDIIFYHTVVCSRTENIANGIYRGFDRQILRPSAPFGKDLTKTGQMANKPGFLRVFNDFEIYQKEARYYGVRLGLILVDPFGKESVDIPTGVSGGITGTTNSSINQYDNCNADVDSGRIIIKDFLDRVKRVSYRRDIILSVGAYPETLKFESTKFADLLQTQDLGAIYNDSFDTSEDSQFFKSIDHMINKSNGKAWFGNNPRLSALHLINKDVKLIAPFPAWNQSTLLNIVSRNNAPNFSIQKIISTNSDEIWQEANDALQYSQRMNTALDFSKLTQNRRISLWKQIKHYHDKRKDLYR